MWFRVAARVRGVTTTLGVFGIVVGVVGGLAVADGSGLDSIALVLGGVGFAMLIAGTALTLVPLAPRIAARPIAPVVAGRWRALNSPASKVPSHGTHGHGQTFAVDLVYEPAEGARPEFGQGPGFRAPQDFPAFGRELYAPDDGLVVAVRDNARDHRSRSNMLAYAYMMVDGSIRELFGSRNVLGNHVIVDLGDGTFAALAHLQHGSARVRRGQRVRRGEQLARCGNSGNSSEPHVHLQLMDHRWPLIAAGMPFVFTGADIDDQDSAAGVPANDRFIRA